MPDVAWWMAGLLVLSRFDAILALGDRLVRRMRGLREFDQARARRIVESEKEDAALRAVAKIAPDLQRLVLETASISHRTEEAVGLLKPNGGTSVKDQMDRMEEVLAQMAVQVVQLHERHDDEMRARRALEARMHALEEAQRLSRDVSERSGE